MRTITAADANRHFSKLLRDVKAGKAVVITSHGQPVARMEPVSPDDDAALSMQAAKNDLIAHLDSVRPLNIPVTWTRDDIYEDDF